MYIIVRKCALKGVFRFENICYVDFSEEHMKRFTALLITAAVLLLLCSCGKTEAAREGYVLDRNFVTEGEENGFSYVTYSDHSEIVACETDEETESIEFPSTLGGKPVTVIGGSMFMGNVNLKSAVIPHGVTDIGNNVFSGCTELSAVSIPDTVRRIGCSAFYGTKWYGSLEGEFVTVGDGVLIKYGGKGGNIVIPKNVAYLSDAFSGNNSIYTVEVPDSVFGISDYAFYRCGSITEIKIPDKMTDIGICILEGTTWLEAEEDEFVTIGDGVLIKYGGSDVNVTVPEGIKYIAGAFKGNTDIESVTLPGSVIDTGDAVFYGCSSLREVCFSGDDTRVGDAAFAECSKLESAKLPKNLRILGTHTFSSCTKLKDVTLPDSVVYIGISAFYNCGMLEQIVLPDQLKELGSSAFFGCIKLKSIALPDSTVRIGTAVFSCCYELESVTLSPAISEIPNAAFSYCPMLTEIRLGKYIKSVGKYAFEASAGIKVYVENDMTVFDGDSFNECLSVPEIICGSDSAAGTFAKQKDFTFTLNDR